jgi:hypothetical protein
MRLICRSSLAAPGRFRPGEIEIVDAAPGGGAGGRVERLRLNS